MAGMWRSIQWRQILWPGHFRGRRMCSCATLAWARAAPAGCAPFTALVSVSLDGLAADGASFTPAISDYGRYVAFVTRAGNIAEGDASHAQKIVVRDTCLNVPQAESCAPKSSLISTPGSGNAHTPFISGDGRFVSYVADDGNAPGGAIRVFLGDTCVGASASSACAPRISLIATSGPGKASELTGGIVGFWCARESRRRGDCAFFHRACARSEGNPQRYGRRINRCGVHGPVETGSS